MKESILISNERFKVDYLNLEYIVKENDADRTVKSILKNELNLSERMIRRLKRNTGLFVNSQPVYVIYRVKPGDIIHANINFEEDCDDIIPENIEIDILYEDEYIIVLNKQPDVVVHPVANHQTGTIANAVMYYLNQKGTYQKIRPVSRLDRDTSGVIVFAKSPYIQNALALQMSSNTFQKEYIGIVWGIVEKPKDTINLPIERKPDSIMLRHVSETGKPSITNYEVLRYFGNATLLKFSLETGRTHQIRVHCQAINHPIIGDTLYWKWSPDINIAAEKYNIQYDIQYGLPCNTQTDTQYDSRNMQEPDEELFKKYKYINSKFIQRQALHSHKVTFNHPVTNKLLEIYAPLPPDINRVLEILENI
jgi:23S rRNA pseudouridine1911/1915/1917 synthase